MKVLTFRNLVVSTLVALGLASCASSEINIEKEDVMKTNRTKVVELLNSIESGSSDAVGYINPNKYIQHNLAVGDGLAGFVEVMAALPKGSAKVEVVRAFEDGEYVFTHTKYKFFGAKAGFDVFRFEDGKIVEHWDNLQEIVEKTASGRTQFDGADTIKDLEKTQENKTLVKNFVRDVLMGKDPSKITEYISTKTYYQHNPHVKDGLASLGEALEALTKAGMPMVYKKNHFILGEGNFVLTGSEGLFMNKHVSFYDLFRIEDGKIVEHWDTIEEIPKKALWKNSNGKF